MGHCNRAFQNYLTYDDNLVPSPLTVKPRSDEPTGTAVSADGRFLYIVNGGVMDFFGPSSRRR